MLVLGRKRDERITMVFGDVQIKILVVDILDGRVRLGIDAPRAVSITRDELEGTGRDVPRSHPDHRPHRSIGWGPAS